METMFWVCFVLGGTVFVFQFVMALIGFGSEDLDLGDDLPDDALSGAADVASHQGHLAGHGSTWLFGVISFRTVVAALAFFGLAGLASLAGGLSPLPALAIAVLSGLAAMYGVHWLMQLLYRLGQDKTIHIDGAVGKRGTVYVPIPGGKAGAGKVQIKLQERLVEYAAMTAEENKLPTGTRVLVTGVVSPTTVEVELIRETGETADA